ncbi:winged helix DNA-binding domain-containing protein [Streptomyces subrutilus]|uniref:winged helix DNA-binding domain-containing protein n=1 Tax=Streptomyces subrutilus TaxID=36818 RepID=UPI003449BFC5
MASRTTHPVLDARALNRATLARQLLLGRAGMAARDAVGHLVGLQAQNVKPPYFQLHARLAGFAPAELAGLMESRQVVRMVTLRSTLHTHTAHDARTLRPLVQPARDREVNQFRKGLVGVDPARLADHARAFVEDEPRTMGEIRAELFARWPDADPRSLAVAARCLLPLVQVTPRGVWGRSGQVRLTTVEHWLGAADAPASPASHIAPDAPASPAAPDWPPAPDAPASPAAASVDDAVLRYLAAFGPASVKDMQVWAGLTRLKEAFERLRPRLAAFSDANGVELFDLPDAPRPDPDTPAPPRFLPEFDNLLLSHADRTRVIAPEVKGRTWTGNQAHRTLLVDGFVAGLWKPSTEGDTGADLGSGITVELFGAVPEATREEIVAEAELLVTTMGGAPAGARGPVRFASIHG